MESLAGKAVIITGGSSGIGEYIALKFAALGSKICITGRNVENLELVAKKCRETGIGSTEVIAVCGDVRDGDHRKDIIARTLEQFGQIDVLVNNAGIGQFTFLAEASEEEYTSIFDTNVKACIFLTQLAIPKLKETKGNIINTSSFVTVQPRSVAGIYCMSKAAVNMFTECLAIDLGPSGVRVNSISPGVTETSFFTRSGIPESGVGQFFEGEATRTPLGRVGQPRDIADAVAFLASDAARYVNGHHLYVDGALHHV